MADHAGQSSNGGAEMAAPHLQNQRMVAIDVNEFIRTRDALLSAHFNLSSSLDRAVKAYLDHTQVVLNGDATLNVGHMLGAFNALGGYANPAQMATLALQQQQHHNGGVLADVKPEEPEKKRKKRTYKQRDPNAPKRPLTAYFRFLGAVRGQISEEVQKDPEKFKDNSGKPGEISLIASERWRQLSPAEQEPYKKAYRDELADYTKRAAEYAKAKGVPLDELTKLDEDATGFEDADEMPQSIPAAAAASAGAKAGKVVDDDDDDDTSTSSEESDDDEPAPPPPPKAAATPKKSALKKSKTPATAAAPQTFSSVPAPTFSSINPPATAPASSPSRKRKGDAEESEPGKKRGRKSKETVAAASDPVAPSSSVAAPEEIQVPDVKKKKERKKKVKGEA